MPKRGHPSNADRVEAVLHAVVYGDDAACSKYGITARSLRRYRDQIRDPESELSATVRRFSAAIKEAQGETAAAEGDQAEDFMVYIQRQVRRASDIIVEKAEQINAANPESIRAVNDHVATLLGHAAALEYIGRLFTPAPDDDGPAGAGR